MTDLHAHLLAAIAKGGATYTDEKHTQEQLHAIWQAANQLDCRHRLVCTVLTINGRLQYDAKGGPLQPILKVVVQPQQPGITKTIWPPKKVVDILLLPGCKPYLVFRKYRDSYGKTDGILSGWVQAEDEAAARQKVLERKPDMVVQLVPWDQMPQTHRRAVRSGEWNCLNVGKTVWDSSGNFMDSAAPNPIEATPARPDTAGVPSPTETQTPIDRYRV